jgi:UDP-N-acetylmuramoyl-L-alanine---L-glutamate ligase
MTLDDLCARRVAVWGIGREGRGTIRLLGRRGVVPVLVDDDPATAESRLAGVDHRPVLGPDQIDWGQVDVVVRAPGVSRYRTELDEARRRGVVVTTVMAVWLEDFADAPVVAVTGTKGKSTTAALLASLLARAGTDAVLIGNIGVPVTETYDAPPAGAYVVEVSSYQAAEVTVTPAVCVLTSLAPDHLDWHGGVEAYYRDKLRLIDAGPAGSLAVNAASAPAVERTREHPHRVLYGPSGRVRVTPSGTLTVDGVVVGSTDGLALPGRHNVENLCGAVAAFLLLLGEAPSAAVVDGVVRGFEGLPSRCRTVGVRHGLTFVDDALASNPFATETSIGAFPGQELTVILGGADRGVDPSSLLDALAARRPVPRVVVLAPDPQDLSVALAARPAGGGSHVPVEMAADLEAAVGLAASATPAGGVVLFSPAAPTAEGEGGFAERSRRFVRAAGLEAAARSG